MQTVPAKNKSLHAVIFSSLLLDLLGFTLILPLLPSILDHYAASDNDSLYQLLQQASKSASRSIGLQQHQQQQHQQQQQQQQNLAGRSWDSVLLGGALGSLFSLLQFLSAPLLGGLSDIWGRRPVLLLSMAGTCVSYCLWAMSANSFTLFFASRIIGGLFRGSVTVATAAVSDCGVGQRSVEQHQQQQQQRSRGMMWIGLAFSLAFLCGPPIGAAIGQTLRADPAGNFALPALLALLFTAAAAAVVAAYLPETAAAAANNNNNNSGDSSSSGGGVAASLRFLNPCYLFSFSGVSAGEKECSTMRTIGLSYFLFLTLFSGLEFTLTFLAHLRFGYSRSQLGGMFVCIGISSSLLQGGLVRRIRAGWERRMAMVAMAALAPAGLLLGNASSQSVFYCGILLFSLCSACVVPSLTSMIGQLAHADHQGHVLGIFRCLGALARAVGPAAAAVLFWTHGPAVSYSLGGLAVCLPVLLLLLMPQSTLKSGAAQLKSQ